MTEGRAAMVEKPVPPPDEQAEQVVRRYGTRRQIITLVVIFAVCVATSWMWAFPSKADTGGDSSVTVLAQAPEPCRKMAAFVGVYEDPDCSDDWWLPDTVKKCVGAAFVGGLLAYISGGSSVLFGVGAGGAGCIPWEGPGG